ncbi:MAG: Crp/Fnr family transcriptional regulator [Cyclobacteriaceae bacterium]
MNALLTTQPTWSEPIANTISLSTGLNQLKNGYDSVSYRKGQILFQEGHNAWGLYYVIRGKLKLYKYGSDGKEQIIRIVGNNEFIAYNALLNDLAYHVTASVIEHSEVAFIPRQDFLDIFSADSEVSQYFTHLLCQNLVETEQRLVAQAYRPVRGRLAEALLALDALFEPEDQNEETFITLSRHDLASLLGTAKETVIRILSEFKADELITTNGQNISVLNPEGLQQVSQMYD